VVGLAASAALAATVLLMLPQGKDMRPDLMSVRDATLRSGLPQGGEGSVPAVPGFTLVAAHRDLVAGHRTEVALYRRGDATVTLCLWAAGREPAHGTVRAVYHGMAIAYWNDGRTEFWAASAAAGPALADFVLGLRGRGEG
jgi:anti-sigma factor RsiW